LKDIHWALVGFGYFPTYALGNLYASQLFEAALEQKPLIGKEFARGNPSLPLDWLHENVRGHGRKLTPAEVVLRATGRLLDHDSFMRYVTAKYSDIDGT